MWIHREPHTSKVSWRFGSDFYLQTWLDLLQDEGKLVCHKSFYYFPIFGDSNYKWFPSIFSSLPCCFILLNVRRYIFQFAYNILNITTWFLFSKATKPTLLLFLFVCSVFYNFVTLYNSMNCSTWGFSALCYRPEIAQIHVHWVHDTI